MSLREAKAKAYLLLEVLVAGVLVATVLGSVAYAIVEGRKSSNFAARDTTAAMLTQQKFEEIRSWEWDYLDQVANGTTTENLTLGTNFTRRSTITDCDFFAGDGGNIDCVNISVIVEYSYDGIVRDVQGTIRIYDPEPT